MDRKSENYKYQIEVFEEDLKRDSVRIKDRGFEFELFISNEDQEISEVQTFLEYIETNDVYAEEFLELLSKAEPYLKQEIVDQARILYSLSKKPWENDDYR